MPPRRVGGNLDLRDLSAGTVLYLPVEVPGGLFSIGDAHAAQGDAVRSMIDLLQTRTTMSAEDAYMLCSVTADLRIGEIVDAPNWVVACYFPRRWPSSKGAQVLFSAHPQARFAGLTAHKTKPSEISSRLDSSMAEIVGALPYHRSHEGKEPPMKEIPEPAHCEICEEAIRHLQKQVATTEGIERARALLDLGMAAFVGYRPDLALASFGACLDLIDQEAFPDVACEALFKESCVLAEMERFDEAIESLSRAKEISDEEGDLEHVALCDWTEGNYLTSYGRTDEARERITAARDRYLELDQPAMAALCERDLKDVTAPPQRVRPKSSRTDRNAPPPPSNLRPQRRMKRRSVRESAPMDAYQIVTTKRDVRNFSSKDVPEEIQTRVLDAGRLSGTGKNSQHWRFILVRQKQNLERLAEASTTGMWVQGANFAVIVLTDPGLGFHKIDAGRAAEDMQLAAWSDGVVSCIYTGIKEPMLREHFDVPEDLSPTIVVGFGYPAEKITGKKKNRKPMEELAYLEAYGNPLKS